MLRDYQKKAVDSLFDYFSEKDGNPLLVLPTGAGKSHIQAAFIKDVLSKWPSERFLLLSHVKEILIQDANKIQDLMPNVTVGIYSAGLGKKETGYQVTIAGIQSVYSKAHELGDISIVILDEAHLCSKNNDTMYRSFFKDLSKFCPKIKIIGLTATPYRLDSGSLILGKERIFTDICYSISIKQLIDQGYLANLVTAPTRYEINTDTVKKQGGEYVIGDLEKFVNNESVTDLALNEVMHLCGDRKSWIVFCCGVDHTRDVSQALRMRGISTEAITGSTPKDLRQDRIDRFKNRSLRCLVSVGVLTTGFDAPNIDALICLRPTLSPGLWIQMVGRAARTYPGKDNALILDFTQNTKTHGPIDLIEVYKNGEPKTKPYKVCPNCGGLISPTVKLCACGYSPTRECHVCHEFFDLSLKFCPECNAPAPYHRRKVEHGEKASNEKILSDQETIEHVEQIEDIIVTRHEKENKPDSVKISFILKDQLQYRAINDWLCFDHGGYASESARRKWLKYGGGVPTPRTTQEALDRSLELDPPKEIKTKKEGKFWKIV